MLTKFSILLILLFVQVNYSSSADEIKDFDNDSVRIFRLGEIVCMANKVERSALPTKISEVSFTQIQKSDPTSLTNIVSLLPSTSYQTNSRGETLIYMRGIGDRRAGIFFDGILMNFLLAKLHNHRQIR